MVNRKEKKLCIIIDVCGVEPPPTEFIAPVLSHPLSYWFPYVFDYTLCYTLHFRVTNLSVDVYNFKSILCCRIAITWVMRVQRTLYWLYKCIYKINYTKIWRTGGEIVLAVTDDERRGRWHVTAHTWPLTMHVMMGPVTRMRKHVWMGCPLYPSSPNIPQVKSPSPL